MERNKKQNSYSKLFINPPYILSDNDKQNDIILRNKGNKKYLIED